MMYQLTDSEKNRLTAGITAAFTIPFIDDIEDFIWEAIFAYTKAIPLVDPLTNIRSKRLFDVVDHERGIGWSIKATQTTTIRLPHIQEVVIQRADIFKKAKELGFAELSLTSSPDVLGAALLHHWYFEKVQRDAFYQQVSDKRVCLLLKSKDRRTYAYLEEALWEYTPDDLQWAWTNSTKTGLQGRRKSDDTLIFRWYPNQKHLFERFIFPEQAYLFHIEPQRLALDDVVALLLAALRDRP